MSGAISVCIEFQCLVCGHKNKKVIESGNFAQVQVVCCDVEGGGCDEYLAIEHKVVPKVRVAKLGEWSSRS